MPRPDAEHPGSDYAGDARSLAVALSAGRTT